MADHAMFSLIVSEEVDAIEIPMFLHENLYGQQRRYLNIKVYLNVTF